MLLLSLLSLPESSNLPSVFMFAECIPSGTRRTSSLLRFAECQKKTLGKEGVCRVLRKTLGKEIKSFFLKKKEKKKNEKKTLPLSKEIKSFLWKRMTKK